MGKTSTMNGNYNSPTHAIPVTTQLRPEESWSSLFNRTASLNGLTCPQLTQWTGLPSIDEHLNEVQLDQASQLLRISPTQLAATHLAGWTGVVYTQHPAAQRSRAGPTWTWITPGSHCRECVNESGYWKLKWRLPWIFWCPRHGRYLSDDAEQPDHLPDDRALALANHFESLLTQAVSSPRHSLEAFDGWRDALRLKHATRPRSLRDHRTDLASASQRANALQRAAPLVSASSPELRAETLARWCRDCGWNKPYRSLLPGVRSSLMRDAVDCVTAAW